MLPQSEIERIEAESVERQRLLYTNEQLWCRLKELDAETAPLKSAIPTAYELAHSGKSYAARWKDVWRGYINNVNANKSLMKAYVWHLVKRGDPDIASWIDAHKEPYFSWYP